MQRLLICRTVSQSTFTKTFAEGCKPAYFPARAASMVFYSDLLEGRMNKIYDYILLFFRHLIVSSVSDHF